MIKKVNTIDQSYSITNQRCTSLKETTKVYFCGILIWHHVEDFKEDQIGDVPGKMGFK